MRSLLIYNWFFNNNVSRSPSHNPFIASVDACVLFAKSISFAYTLDISSYGRSFAPTAHSVIETTYFLLLFLVRSLLDQYHTKHNIHSLQRLVLSTFCPWLEGAMAIITFGRRIIWTWHGKCLYVHFVSCISRMCSSFISTPGLYCVCL